MFQAAEEMLRAEVLEGRCYGYALAVGQGDRVVHKAMGGRLGGPESLPVTEETRYDASSLTEALVAAPLSLLALEKGWLTLSDPISNYLDVPADKRGITLWHLLTHTSGMKSNFLLEQAAENAEDGLRAALNYPLSALTGKRVRRSSMGFIVLGKLLEQVYGLPLDEAAKRYVFQPLGMKRTGYLPSGEDVAQIDVDEETGEPRKGLPHDENARFLHGVAAHAGIFLTLTDCCRYLAMLTLKGQWEGKAFLTREAVALMTADHTGGLKEARGLGVGRAGRDVTFMGDLWPENGYGHEGDTGVSLAVAPESGLYVALLMNRTRPSRESEELLRLRRCLHNCIHAEFSRWEA